MSPLSTSRHGNIDASRLHAGHQAFHQYNKHYRNYTRWLSNLQTRQPTIHLQQKVSNHFMMSHPMNAPARRGHSSSVTPKLAVHQHYTETRHSSWSAAMCAANHAVQLMSHVSTAAAMTTRQTSCVPVQRIPVASLGSCQTHLVVEEAMKPRDAGCTTVTPLRRPQHAHTCLDEMHRRFRRARHRADDHAPLDSPMERKAWPPPSHHQRVITLPGSSLCLLQATRRWGAPGRYSGGEASTIPAPTRNSLCFHAQVSHAPSHSIYGFDSHRRLSSRKGDMTAASRQPLPMMLQVQSPCTSAFPR